MNTATEKKEKVRRSRSSNEWAVSGLADVAYNVSHNVQVIELYRQFMPPGQLKEFFRVFGVNQEMWKQKMIRVFDDIARNSGGGATKEIGVDMRKDIDGDELLAYMDATADLKKALHMEGVAQILKLLCQVKDMDAIYNNLYLIIQNQINKEAL